MISVGSALAATKLHETFSDNGVMKMPPVAGLQVVPSGEPVTPTLRGFHVVLIGLKALSFQDDRTVAKGIWRVYRACEAVSQFFLMALTSSSTLWRNIEM